MNIEDKKVVLSVCMITYNHESHIREALDGVVMQKTTFKVELIIGEDCSTDNTRKICEEYAEEYPELIRLLPSVSNLGMQKNGIRTLQACTGKYVALLDGDDYWTDPLKLQKQVDFLENNKAYGICAHKALVKNDVLNRDYYIPEINADLDYDFKDYILRNNTATCSLIFRKNMLSELPTWFSESPFGDLSLVLHVMNKTNKTIHVLKDVMGVYRVHTGGIHGKYYQNKNELIKSYKQHILFNKQAEKEYANDKILKKTFYKKYIDTYKIIATLYKQNNNKLSSFKYAVKSYYYSLLKKIDLL